MSPPLPTVYVQGQGNVSADGLNTFQQVLNNVAQARTFAGVAGMAMAIMGTTSPGDGGGGPFWWNALSNATDDNGVTTIVPFGVTTGAWIRMGSFLPQLISFASTPSTVAVNGSTIYLGPSGGNSDSQQTGYALPPGGAIVTGFGVSSNLAAGAGQTINFTLYFNGGPTSMIASMSGSSVFSATVTGSLQVGAGTLSIQATGTSGAPSAVFFRYYITFILPAL